MKIVIPLRAALTFCQNALVAICNIFGVGTNLLFVPVAGIPTSAPGAPGAPHVPNANVPLTTQVHTALTQTHCVKCGTPITAGNPFCGNCGNAVVAAAGPGMGPGAGMPMGYVPVAGAPGAIPATAGAPFMG